MTEKTLRERLPVGNPRNKLEFLADEMDMTASEIFAQLERLKSIAGGAPVNLLANGDFNENMGLPSIMVYLHSLDDANTKPDLMRTIGNGRNSMSVTSDWAVDVPHGLANVVGFKVNPTSDSTYAEYGDSILPNSGSLSYFGKAFTLYQVLTVPINGLNHRQLKGRFFVTPAKGMEVTVGIARLYADERGNVRVHNVKAEKTTTFNETDPWKGYWVESEEYNPTSYGGNGLMALYIKVKNPLSTGRIYAGQLWHVAEHGKAPTLVNQHNPHSYQKQFSFKNITSQFAEVVAPNTVKWHLGRHLHYLFNPAHHIAVDHGMTPVKSAQVIAIEPDSVTVQYSPDDFNKRIANDAGAVRQTLAVQYSVMPFGLGLA